MLCKYCGSDKPLDAFVTYVGKDRQGRRIEGHRSHCKACNGDYNSPYQLRYRPKKLEQERTRRIQRRAAILAHYGVNGVPMCHCCGETRLEFLGVDHIEGGGNAHRRELTNSLYGWLVKNNFPPGFRDLCHNCNQSLGAYGYCPHQTTAT